MITNNYLFSSQFVNFLKSKKIEADHLNAFKNILIPLEKELSQNSHPEILNSFIKHFLNILQFAYDQFSENELMNGSYVYLYDGFPLQKKVSCLFVVGTNNHIDSTFKGSFPAFELIQLLKNENLEWGILTDGVKWRLYSILNTQPYENYFEVDFSSYTDIDFQAFYHLFSVLLFIPDEHQVTPLEHFIEASEKESRIIEDHLKANINEILETISYGFLTYSGRIHTPLTEEEKQEYFNNSVYLLYRLLFIFYAESRRLLPINSPEYRQVSLESMLENSKYWLKDSIFENEEGTDLWDKFRELCIHIDQGNSSYNIPEYDGGLFDISQHPFLSHPDNQLTNKTFAKVLYSLGYFSKGKNAYKIDYRDLSVRSLGTLYEGILEYKLFIAKDDLVLRDKKFIPKSEAGYLKKSDREIPAGHVYFSQDAEERHDSGSYYTPEDVVNYIINNSVRLGLEERWIDFLPVAKKLEADLKAAYSLPIRNSLLQRFDTELLRFIETKILTFRVIDPAMGSGHFLVDALHCITHFIIEVLSCSVHISDGPIKHDKTPISIDWSLFHGISNLSVDPGYWRRKVVESCIFGIDLNPLATELSKLALWIASSSEGKPLAFLNHHLKKGDSIMGIGIKDMLAYPVNSNAKKTKSDLKLFDKFDTGKFETIKNRFTELLSLSSDDISEVSSKKEIFAEIESDKFLERLKDLATLWLMISFDLNKSRSKTLFDTTNLPDEDTFFSLLQQVQEVNDDNQWIHAIGEDLYREIQAFVHDKSVFHWELEFPEIISNGFDAAIGNPPYVDVVEDDYIGVPLQSSKSTNLYAHIPEVAYNNLKPDQYLSFITPMAIICSKRMIHIQDIFKKETWFLYNIDSSSNPGCLFKTIRAHLNIFHLKKDKKHRIYSSSHRRFYQFERKDIFKRVAYYKIEDESIILDYTIPKISNEIEEKILKVLFQVGKPLSKFLSDINNQNCVYYRSANAPYYLFAYEEPPTIDIDGTIRKSSSIASVNFKDEYSKYVLMATFYSSLYYWFWIVYSDCYNMHPKDINRFPLDIQFLSECSIQFENLYKNIEIDLIKNAEYVVYKKANGITKYKLLRAKKSKSLFDQVDRFLGKKIGLDDNMIEFLINYDSKYRMDESCQENS